MLLHSWVQNLNKTTQQWRGSHNYLRKRHHSYLAFTWLFTWISAATDTTREQSMYYARLPWREHRAIRHSCGRHPVFTGKPLKPGLMHSKHTSLHKCGWWLSGPFPFSPPVLRVIGGLLNGPSSGDGSCFIRLGSPEPGAQMKPLDIYSSTTVLPPLSGSSIVTSSSAEGRMGSVQTASDEADIPFRLLCVYLRKPLCWVLASVKDFGSIVEVQMGFKVKITGIRMKETYRLNCSLIYCERKG